jgi:hypothetical protein
MVISLLVFAFMAAVALDEDVAAGLLAAAVLLYVGGF